MIPPIPYTNDGFNTIMKNSRVFHNNREVNPNNVNYKISDNNGGTSFIMSFINELDMYIQTIMYDVEICNKVKNYIDVQMLKWGKFMNKEMLPYFADIDMKYVSMFKERGFVTNLIAPYVCDNVMIMD